MNTIRKFIYSLVVIIFGEGSKNVFHRKIYDRTVDFSKKQAYMMLGCIPFYLKYLDKTLSLAQNIDSMFFSENAILSDEFDVDKEYHLVLE